MPKATEGHLQQSGPRGTEPHGAEQQAPRPLRPQAVASWCAASGTTAVLAALLASRALVTKSHWVLPLDYLRQFSPAGAGLSVGALCTEATRGFRGRKSKRLRATGERAGWGWHGRSLQVGVPGAEAVPILAWNGSDGTHECCCWASLRLPPTLQTPLPAVGEHGTKALPHKCCTG